MNTLTNFNDSWRVGLRIRILRVQSAMHRWSCSIQTPSKLNTCTSQNVKVSFLHSYTPCEHSCVDVADISLLQRPPHPHRAVLCWVTETMGSRPLNMEIPKRPPSTNQLQRAVVDACQSASAPTKSNGMYLRRGSDAGISVSLQLEPPAPTATP